MQAQHHQNLKIFHLKKSVFSFFKEGIKVPVPVIFDEIICF